MLVATMTNQEVVDYLLEKEFQSLIGINVSCNAIAQVSNAVSFMFQSLIGINVSCNPFCHKAFQLKGKFQSLIGINVSCNCSIQ